MTNTKEVGVIECYSHLYMIWEGKTFHQILKFR
jgi:hypothetical protein